MTRFARGAKCNPSNTPLLELGDVSLALDSDFNKDANAIEPIPIAELRRNDRRAIVFTAEA